MLSKSNQWVSQSVSLHSTAFQLALKQQVTKEEKNRNKVMDAKSLTFKAFQQTFLHLDDFSMFPKLK